MKKYEYLKVLIHSDYNTFFLFLFLVTNLEFRRLAICHVESLIKIIAYFLIRVVFVRRSFRALGLGKKSVQLFLR